MSFVHLGSLDFEVQEKPATWVRLAIDSWGVRTSEDAKAGDVLRVEHTHPLNDQQNAAVVQLIEKVPQWTNVWKAKVLFGPTG